MKAFIVAAAFWTACADPSPPGPILGAPRWAIAVTSPGQVSGTAVAFDSSGDVIAAGNRQVDLQSRYAVTGMLTKRAATDGAEIWTRELRHVTDDAYVAIADIAVGPDDSVVVTGSFSGTIDVAGRTISSPADHRGYAFIASFSPAGDVQWLTTLGDAAAAAHVAVDADGRVFVAGTFVNSTLQFNAQSFAEVDNDPDTFVVAFDRLGTMLWGTAYQGAAPGTMAGSGPFPGDIAVAPNGDVLVACSFSGPIRVGDHDLTPQAEERTFITRHHADGALVSVHQVTPRSGVNVAFSPSLATMADGRTVIQQVEWSYTDGSQRSTIRVFDNEHELWASAPVNHSPMTPQQRTLATTGDLILSSAWIGAPLNTDPPDGSMELLAFRGDGSASSESFGARMKDGPASTMPVDMAVSTDAIAYTGVFAGTIAFGEAIVAVEDEGWNQLQDMFVVVVSTEASR